MSSSESGQSRNGSSENGPSSNTVHTKERKLVEIDNQDDICSVAFLVDRKHIVSGGWAGKMRRWRVEDSTEVGTPMDAKHMVCNIAVSQDGKWVVSGTESGEVTVWNAGSHEKARNFKGHKDAVLAVDISLDGTKIATGSKDDTASVWSLSTGERLRGPVQHDDYVVGVKFSPNGRYIATATWLNDSVRIYEYDSKNSRPLVDIPIQVHWSYNQTLAWTNDSRHLFVLSHDGNINCLDLDLTVSTGATPSRWSVHSSDEPRCIALANNGTFIAASAKSSISFWDTRTHERIGPVISHTTRVQSMAISANHDLAIGGGKSITLHILPDILPPAYCDDIFPERAMQRMKEERVVLDKKIESLYAEIACLKENVQRLSDQISDSQHRADHPNETIESNEESTTAAKFKLQNFPICRAICDILENNGYVLEAVQCFQRLQTELGEDTGNYDGNDATHPFHAAVNILEKEPKSIDKIEWIADFKARCLKTLEQRGAVTMESASYKDAVDHYTAALILNPFSTDLLTKRSQARAGIGSWNDSLGDADAAIKLDPSSPHGYERKHAALLGARRYDEAINIYSEMFLNLAKSPDPVIRESRNHYVSPSQTEDAIRDSVKETQQDAPLVLIDTETGHLHNKQERFNAFKVDPAFKELVASISMTTGLNNIRITQTVQKYFRYGTFSHTWEGDEPSFHDVLRVSVHGLTAPPTISKLVKFCAIVREAGLRWAWSDTCCINKPDSSVLQESLTSMFRWYHGSALTIVHLKDVLSDLELNAFKKSRWNTRAWTLQEFFASPVIRFYTEDWKLYLPQENADNHKKSFVIMGKIAAANNIDAQALLSLQPGPDHVRQKLCLAAMRSATKPEDKAYSLFGIFKVSFPVTYGEGQQHALGRLLQEVLTRSSDVTILAWTGAASDYNNCFPAEIGVYHEPESLYIPPLIEDDNMGTLVAELRKSSEFTDSALTLYEEVTSLPSSRLASYHLSLPCIMFPLKGLFIPSGDSQHVYRATAPELEDVEIKTTKNLRSLKTLVLVHPWLRCLLDPAHRSEVPTVSSMPPGGDGDSDSPPNRLNKALRLFARLRQPFGALLLVRLENVNEYKRVASDNLIVAQLRENVSPRRLAEMIQTLDIK